MNKKLVSIGALLLLAGCSDNNDKKAEQIIDSPEVKCEQAPTCLGNQRVYCVDGNRVTESCEAHTENCQSKCIFE